MIKTVEDCPVQLTDAEKLLKTAELCRLAIERNDLDDKKKAAVAMYKNQGDDLDEQVKDLVRELHTGIELRPIECFERPLYGEMMVEIVRTDDNSVHRRRAMHPSERQLAVDVGDAPSPTKGRKRRAEFDDEGTAGTH